MDWFSWLSKTHLEHSSIHEYAEAFSVNQLEEDDISYFNHEFLQSMGISIAKHRLEILKLAKTSSGSHPMAMLMRVVKKTKRTLVRYVRTWVHRNDSAMVKVKRRSYSSRWKGAMVKRSNRLVMNKQGSGTLLITNGYRPVVRPSGGARVTSFSSLVVYNFRHDESKEDGGHEYSQDLYSDDDYDDGGVGGGSGGYGGNRGSGGGEYWSDRGVEEIKWDAMFQNLKPT